MVCLLLPPSPHSLHLADTIIRSGSTITTIIHHEPPPSFHLPPPIPPLDSTSYPPFPTAASDNVGAWTHSWLYSPSPDLLVSSPPLSGSLNHTSWCWRTGPLCTQLAMICAALMVLEDRASLHAAYHECTFISLPQSCGGFGSGQT